MLQSDAAWWGAMTLLLLCLGLAWANGLRGVDNASAAVAAARADEAVRLERLVQALSRMEAGQQPIPAQSYRDPGNALAVARGQAATVMALPPAPLAALGAGLGDLYPPFFAVKAGSKDRFLFDEDIANPGHLLSGSFDVVFVVVYLLPLVLLALSHDLLSAEREQGTWPLVCATPRSPWRVLLFKASLRAGVPMVVGLVALASGALATATAPIDSEGWWSLAALVLLVLMWCLFWLAWSLWVNSWGRSSSFNAATLVVSWLLLLWGLPALVNAVAASQHPSPSRADVVLAVRQATVDTQRHSEAAQLRWLQDHPQDTQGALRLRQEANLALLHAADNDADERLREHDHQTHLQRALSDRLSWWIPSMRIYPAMWDLAGAGHARWDAFLGQVHTFHGQWQDHFVAYARKEQRLKAADYAQFPRPAQERIPVWQPDALMTLWQALLVLAVQSGVLLALARRRVLCGLDGR